MSQTPILVTGQETEYFTDNSDVMGQLFSNDKGANQQTNNDRSVGFTPEAVLQGSPPIIGSDSAEQ